MKITTGDLIKGVTAGSPFNIDTELFAEAHGGYPFAVAMAAAETEGVPLAIFQEGFAVAATPEMNPAWMGIEVAGKNLAIEVIRPDFPVGDPQMNIARGNQSVCAGFELVFFGRTGECCD